MPVVNGVGVNIGTAHKLRQLGKTLPLVLSVSHKALVRTGGTFRLIDMNAGCGRYEFAGEMIEGSAVIMARFAMQLTMPTQVVLIERDPDNCHLLGDVLGDYGALSAIDIRCGDNRQIAPSVCAVGSHYDRGVVLFDPNGPDNRKSGNMFAIAAELSELTAMRGVDFLLHVPTRTIKLIHRAKHSHRFREKGLWRDKDGRLLHERIADIRKDFWMIREPYGYHGWTFLYGANYRLRNGWKREGFYWTDTPEGRDLLMRLSLPGREQQEDQYDHLLFDEAGLEPEE